ncbi:MAG: hypothetical protein EPN93_12495 [Spirochaetes bacterium]|nr:MAG: hypothetical protein EPN93_12495 [Spirochaetota bacterium]
MRLNLSIALLLWLVSGFASAQPRIAQQILWSVTLCRAGFTATGIIYFFMASAIAAVILRIAKGRQKHARENGVTSRTCLNGTPARLEL